MYNFHSDTIKDMYRIMRGTQVVIASEDYQTILRVSNGLTARHIEHEIIETN